MVICGKCTRNTVFWALVKSQCLWGKNDLSPPVDKKFVSKDKVREIYKFIGNEVQVYVRKSIQLRVCVDVDALRGIEPPNPQSQTE